MSHVNRLTKGRKIFTYFQYLRGEIVQFYGVRGDCESPHRWRRTCFFPK